MNLLDNTRIFRRILIQGNRFIWWTLVIVEVPELFCIINDFHISAVLTKSKGFSFLESVEKFRPVIDIKINVSHFFAIIVVIGDIHFRDNSTAFGYIGGINIKVALMLALGK